MPSVNINELDYSRDWKLRSVENGGTGWSSDWDPDNPFAEDNTYQTNVENTTAFLSNLAFDKFNIPFNKNNTIDDIIHNIQEYTEKVKTRSFKWTPYIATDEFTLADFGRTVSDITKFNIQILNRDHAVSALPPQGSGDVFRSTTQKIRLPGTPILGHTYRVDVVCYHPTFMQGGVQLSTPNEKGYKYITWSNSGSTLTNDHSTYGYGINHLFTTFTVAESVDLTDVVNYCTLDTPYHACYISHITLTDVTDSKVLYDINPTNMRTTLKDFADKPVGAEHFVPYYPKWFDGTGVADIEAVFYEPTSNTGSPWTVACVDPYGNSLCWKVPNSVTIKNNQLIVKLPIHNEITPRFVELAEYSVFMEFKNVPSFKGVISTTSGNLSGDYSYYVRSDNLTTINVDVSAGNCVVFDSCVIHPSYRTAITSPIFKIGKSSTVKFVNCTFTVTTHAGTSKNFVCLWKDCFQNLGRCVFENCEILTGERNSWSIRTVEAISAADTSEIRSIARNYVGISGAAAKVSLFNVTGRGPSGGPAMVLYGSPLTEKPFELFLPNMGLVRNGTYNIDARLTVNVRASFPGCMVDMYRTTTSAADVDYGPFYVGTYPIPTDWTTDTIVIPPTEVELNKPTASDYVYLMFRAVIPAGECIEFVTLRNEHIDRTTGDVVRTQTTSAREVISIMDPDDTTIYNNTIIRSHIG